jgi:CheY-like chemotaxis protein
MGDDDRHGYALVVGRDGGARQETVDRLERIGVASVPASAEELLGSVERPRPLLIVLDTQDGREECHRTQARLRRDSRLRDLAVLVLGEESDLESLAEAVGHGASAYLCKRAGDEVLSGFVEKLGRTRCGPPSGEKRGHARRLLLVPVEVAIWGVAGRATAWLMDASATGCCIETAATLNEGDTIQLWLPLAEATAQQPLAGRARWARGASGGLTLAGIRFAAAAAFIAGLALGIDAD